MLLKAPLHVAELYAGTARSADLFRGWRRCKLSLLVDINPFAKETYLRNFPGSPYALENLSRAKFPKLLALAGGRVDILFGCPPCQGFSDGGNRDPDDPRNSHLLLFGHFAAALKPMAVAMENVPLAAGSRQYQAFVRLIERAGYAWTASIVNAALWGSSQTRQRLIFVAIRRDVKAVPRIPMPTHGGQKNYFSYATARLQRIVADPVGMLGETPSTKRIRRTLPHLENGMGSRPIPAVGDALGGLPCVGSPEASRLCHRPWEHTSKQLRRMYSVPEGGRWRGGLDHFSHSYGRLHRKGLARTITTFFPNAGSGRFWHPTENRALTLREAARIQGFPDSFAFFPPYSGAAPLVGNALDGAIAHLIFRVIKSALD